MVVLVVALAICEVASASPPSDKFLDFLVGTNEPGPMAVLPASAELRNGTELSSSTESGQYEKDLALALDALIERGFQAVRLSADMHGMELHADLYNPRISGMDRTIGRAARVLDSYAPEVFQTLNICYLEQGVVRTVCYKIDRFGLTRYFDRVISRWQLSSYVKRSEYSSNESETSAGETDWNSASIVVESSRASADARHVDHGLFSGYSIVQSNRLGILANPIDIGHYLNDQHGGFFPDMKSKLSADAYLSESWSIHSAVFYRWDSPSDAEPSDSLLPRVRSNIDLYRGSKEAKIDKLYASYTTAVSQNTYFNASLGYQEEMFGGLSTQLYKPEVWAGVDVGLTGDWLRQREIENPQAFDNYDVLSALLGMRFRWSGLPNDMRIYAGRFLAEDDGVRVDIGHRFANNMRLGFWYSYTDKKDETGPGSPGDPYRGQGITLTIPLNAITQRRDTRKIYDVEYVPHLRDTAQMLQRPIDLFESHTLKSKTGNQLERFGQ